MSITKIAGLAFKARQKDLERHYTEPLLLQQEVLRRLVRQGCATEYGRSHGFDSVRGYDDFAKASPVNSYEELKRDIDRMRHGERDVLWPGTVKWYAKSSGTTNDKSKFIPVSRATDCIVCTMPGASTRWLST